MAAARASGPAHAVGRRPGAGQLCRCRRSATPDGSACRRRNPPGFPEHRLRSGPGPTAMCPKCAGHGLMRHRPPRVIGRRRVGVPDVTGVPGQLPGLQRPDHDVAVHDGTPGRVDDVGTALHGPDQLVIEKVVGLGGPAGCGWTARRDGPGQRTGAGVEGQVQLVTSGRGFATVVSRTGSSQTL